MVGFYAKLGILLDIEGAYFMSAYTIHQGLLQPCEFIASPNFGQRPNPADIHLIVIHNISLPPVSLGGWMPRGNMLSKRFFKIS